MFSSFLFLFRSIYSPTRVSKTLPQKSLFARTNRIPKRMFRLTMANWVSHTEIGRFIFPRWSSLVFLVAYQLSYICLPLRVIDSQLKYFLSIIHDSFLFIALIALQFARKFLLFVAVIEEFVSTFIILIDNLIRQINRVTFVLRNLQLKSRLCSRETSTQDAWHNLYKVKENGFFHFVFVDMKSRGQKLIHFILWITFFRLVK